jgi:hypothetical protein
MTELFTRFQQSLRDFKNEHGIDMAHPNGAIIHGKPYPAIEKRVDIHVDRGGTFHFTHRFAIPLENGHRVRVKKDSSFEDVYSELHIPTTSTFIQPDNTHRVSRGHRPAYVHTEHLTKLLTKDAAHHVHEDEEMFHEYLKSTSRLPRFGISSHFKRSRNDLNPLHSGLMTDNELDEHFQDVRTRPTAEEYPHNIHLYLNDSKDPQNAIRQYDYNIKTEQLTTDEEWD